MFQSLTIAVGKSSRWRLSEDNLNLLSHIDRLSIQALVNVLVHFGFCSAAIDSSKNVCINLKSSKELINTQFGRALVILLIADPSEQGEFLSGKVNQFLVDLKQYLNFVVIVGAGDDLVIVENGATYQCVSGDRSHSLPLSELLKAVLFCRYRKSTKAFYSRESYDAFYTDKIPGVLSMIDRFQYRVFSLEGMLDVDFFIKSKFSDKKFWPISLSYMGSQPNSSPGSILTAEISDVSLQKLAPAIYSPSFRDAVGEACGSWRYSVSNMIVYRSVAGLCEPRGPNDWHYDYSPPGLLRAIIYISDVSDSSGPFAVMDDSQGGGFEHRIVGRSGTVILFNANAVLHRATPPIKSDRVAIDLCILPISNAEAEAVYSIGTCFWHNDRRLLGSAFELRHVMSSVS